MSSAERIAAEIVLERRARRGEAFDLWREYVNPAWAELLQSAGWRRGFVRARGLELEDEQGRPVLDFLSGFGVLGLGHNHPAVKAALRAVLDEDAAGFLQVGCCTLTGLAAERLTRKLPDDLRRVFFCSSGSEAVEAALKLTRAATGRGRLVACEGAYHGSTLGALGLKGCAGARDRFRPLLPGVDHIPCGDLDALRRTLRWGDVAALVVEPVLGEGGAVVPDPAWLREAAAVARRHGALLVVDEVQTGLGRTGRWFAFEHSGIRPDVVTVAKVLGGGLVPVGAMVARAEVFDRAYGDPRHCMDHAATFGGGPLAMAAVLATLRVLEEERLVERAADQGAKLRQALDRLQRRHACIQDVRGVGLMLGVKFSDAAGGRLEGTPLAGLGQASTQLFAQYVALRLLDEHDILTQAAVVDPSVLKVMPPLGVTDEALRRFVEALDAVLSDAGHGAALARFATEALRRRFG